MSPPLSKVFTPEKDLLWLREREVSENLPLSHPHLAGTRTLMHSPPNVASQCLDLFHTGHHPLAADQGGTQETGDHPGTRALTNALPPEECCRPKSQRNEWILQLRGSGRNTDRHAQPGRQKKSKVRAEISTLGNRKTVEFVYTLKNRFFFFFQKEETTTETFSLCYSRYVGSHIKAERRRHPDTTREKNNQGAL